MAALLSVAGLNSYYGRAHILADVAIDVAKGEVVVLLGRNGAGKSTTMKSLMGLVQPAAGTVTFDGADITGRAPHDIAQAGLGYVPEDRRIFTDLTVMENLEVGRQKPREGAPAWTPERLFAIFPNLAEMRTRPGGRMSGGEQQMLTIARTLMGNPRAILLDEPSEGLAPVIIEQMANTIRALKREGPDGAALGAEPAFRDPRVRPCLHHREGPHPLPGHDRRADARRRGQGAVPVGLAVEPQQVVRGKAEAADGRVSVQATMWAMPVVAMEPARKDLRCVGRSGHRRWRKPTRVTRSE